MYVRKNETKSWNSLITADTNRSKGVATAIVAVTNRRGGFSP